MSIYKNVAGEKAYIGGISHGMTNLILCNTYSNPEEICSKLAKCRIPFQNIVAELIYEEKEYNAVGKRQTKVGYIVSLCEIPVEDAFNLLDWKE